MSASASVEIVTALARYLPEALVDEACQLLRSKDALSKLELMAREVHALIGAAPTAPLKDDAEEGRAGELVSRAEIALRELDALRRKHTDPLNAEVRAINALFKGLTDRPESVYGKRGPVERLILAYRAEKAARKAREEAEARRRQEEAARKEGEALARAEDAKTEAARRKALAEADAASREQTAAAIAVPEPMTKGLRTDSGTLSARERWTFEVVDAAAVPRSFCVPDERAIRAAVAAGVRSIAGVNIHPEESLTRRPGR